MKGKFKIWVIPAAFIVMIFLFPNTALLSIASANDVVIVGNNSVPVTSISEAELKGIFLGQVSKWDDGSKIKFVVLKDGETHKNFLKKYVGKTPSQFNNYWKKQVFTGKGRAPKSFKSEEELIDYVAKTPGAVGYVSSEADKDLVKIISVN